MLTRPRAASFPLASLVLVLACSGDYDNTASPPTAGSADSGTSDETSSSGASTDPDPSSPDDSAGDSMTGEDGESGPGEPTSSGGVDATDEGSSTGETEAPCDARTHACVVTPEGWNGPVASTITPAGQMIACVDDYADAAFSGVRGLEVSAAECECNCGSPQGASCEDEGSLVFFPPNFLAAGNNVTGCEIAASNTSVSGTEDLNAVTPSRWIGYGADATGGSCMPSSSVELPDPVLAERIHGCGPTEEPLACEGGGQCLPKPAAPFEASMCVWKSGEHDCPAEFGDERIVYDHINDDRGCSTCSCGSPNGITCDDGEFTLWTTDDLPHDIAADGVCRYLGGGPDVTEVSFDPGDPSGGSCNAIGGDPNGSVELVAPLTICCS